MTNPEAKIRNRPSPVFDAKHPKVKDNKDHFPLGNENQARNALARANQYKSAPEWWAGSLQELLNAVAKKVKSKYKSIEVSKESTKPGKKKASVEDSPNTEKSFETTNDYSTEKPVDFNAVLDKMLTLKASSKMIYDMAIQELQDKVDSKQSHNGWNPEQLKLLLDELLPSMQS
jgi:hypothetical protein